MANEKHNQLELFAIPNPCIGICQTNPRGYCIGCLRSRDERFNWHLKTEQEQRKIIQLLTQRKARIAQHQKSKTLTHADKVPLHNATQASLFDVPTKNSGSS